MDLDSRTFLVALAALVLAAVSAAAVHWPRLGGRTPAHALGRVLVLALCQLLAVALVLVSVNDRYGIYTSWRDLFGKGSSSQPTFQPGDPRRYGNGSLALEPAANGWQQATLNGVHSGLSGAVYVWLPPQYTQPQYAKYRFPVLELLHGVPGAPENWTNGFNAAGALAADVAAGRAQPFVLVAPAITFNGQDTMCSDAPGGPKIDTWLTLDVRTAVQSTLRVSPSADGWGLLGISTGGLCASKLALQHAGEYRAAASLAGDAANTSTLLDHQQRDANSPLWLLANRPAPNVDLLLAASREDATTAADAEALAAAVSPPTTATLMIQPTGGHNPGVWNGMLPGVFTWLSRVLTA
ncbi:alpha/beta hydrolase [Kitasatospora sp. NPDC101176]|uniref:alpha/beta hydrolase n=1 Tax=Kitasatospora sp. NPDC101176 TaxID=3364099 RepID=UPI003803BDDA